MKHLSLRLIKLLNLRFFLVFLIILLFGLLGYRVGRDYGRAERAVLGIETLRPTNYESKMRVEERKRIHTEVSPDGTRNVVLYEMPFTGEGDLDYRNYLSGQHLYSVEDLSLTSNWEFYVFVGDYKSGYPQWLNNDYVFFTDGCGSGCRALYLVNTLNKEVRSAVIETDVLSKEKFETRFHDWFDHDYRFSGWSKNIRSVFIDDKAYLIFQMWDNNQPLDEKRFLFTGNSLELLN